MEKADIMMQNEQRLKIGCRCNMNYHNLTYPDMNNGDGLRVVLWLSGCSHHCHNCQNPQTWEPNSGVLFDENSKIELFNELEKDYISGLTLTGGDPLHENNLSDVLSLTEEIRVSSPKKTIWLYTGYTWEELFNTSYSKDYICTTTTDRDAIYRQQIIRNADVLVDGRYIDSQRDITLKWRGSKNQRVIDVQKSLREGSIVLWTD